MIPATPGQQTKEPMHIPARHGPDPGRRNKGTAESVTGGEFADGVLHLTERQQTFVFGNVATRLFYRSIAVFRADQPAFSINPRQISCISHAMTATFSSRCKAINHLAIQDLMQAVKVIAEAVPPRQATHLISHSGCDRRRRDTGAAFRAQALALPSETDIAREIGSDIDNDAIHAARERGDRIDRFDDCWPVAGALREHAAAMALFSPDAASAGRRSLKNSALNLALLRRSRRRRERPRRLQRPTT